MADTHAKCRQCRTAMTLQPVDPVFGEEGALKVVLMHLPLLICANQHKRFATPDFPRQLLERVSGEEMTKLPAAKADGWLVKRYACGGCGAKLQGGEAREETFDFDVALPELPPLRVEVTVPLEQCASCGKEQIRRLEKMRELLPAAMAHAFQAAGVRPG